MSLLKDILKAIEYFNINPDCRQYAYDAIINHIRQRSIQKLNIDDMEAIRHFLAQWRVRGTDRIDRKALLISIKAIADTLNELNKISILTINVAKYGKKIEQSYKMIRNVYGVGDTSTSKIIHLFAPSLFVMWDKNIAILYKVVMDSYIYTYKFLPEMQKIAKSVLNELARNEGCTLDEAEKILRIKAKGRTLAKIIDEYNWLRATGRI